MVKRLLNGFRDAGRPIVHNITTFQPDYTDAQLRHGRHGLTSGGQALLLEGSWGAQIVDELAPRRGEYAVVKKGYGGFANPALNTILRFRGVTTCVVAGVTTAICVSSTIRGGVEYNYRMVLVEDAVAGAIAGDA
jgi:nicotinamidase-related amidase